MQKVQKESIFLCFLLIILFFIGQACESKESNRESLEDGNEMIEGEDVEPAEDTSAYELDSAEISDMRRLERDGIKYQKLLDSIAEANPNISYTYTPSNEGLIKTILGDYKVVVDGTEVPEEQKSIALILEKSFSTRQDMLSYYNKLNEVDMPARPKMGYPEYYEKIQEKISYPESAKIIDLEGLMFVEISIERNGALSEIKVVESLNNPDPQLKEQISESAIKAIRATQAFWLPAQADGEPVRSKLELPIWIDAVSPQS